jgi:AcrR family transcriptional regulator
MIADEIGVTKAAVYHQYNTKDEIVRAVADAELTRLEEALDSAEAGAAPDGVREAVVERIVGLAIERRHQIGSLLNDPVIGRLYAHDRRLTAVLGRLNRLLMGPGAGPESHVATAMLTAAISGAVMHPMVVDLDDATLRDQLERLAHRFLDIRR